MPKFFLTAAALSIGAVSGAGLRYSLTLVLSTAAFPWATLVANTLGCLALGFIWQYSQETSLSEFARLLLIVGFCGSLTTFSSVMFELMTMMKAGDLLKAALYFLSVNILGFLAVYIGSTHI